MFYSAPMRFGFTDEQEALRRTVRRAVERGRVDDLGLAGLIVPEELGGAGLGWVEVVAVMEELGRGIAEAPVFSTVCLGAAALRAGGDPARELLPAIARGEATATVAHAGRLDVDGDRVSGTVGHVVDGDTADLIVVAAGDALWVVRGDAVARRRLPTMDASRPLAEITADRVPAVRIAGTLDRALALARIGLAAEQVGGAQRCLELSVDYAKVRHQFGRPIGSFQAIQHRLADMFVHVESARSAAYYAGWAADHAPDELDVVSAAVAATCGEAFYQCAAETIQVHGGIGFTWEHEAHRQFKRARASRALLGAPDHHRDLVARHVLGAP
jgi:alkylation response protein AidB-like acyl-CoA dehydrogenase